MDNKEEHNRASVKSVVNQQFPRDTFDFVCHLRRTPDGRVLLIGLPKGNEPIADELMPELGDAGGVFEISFTEHLIHDRTEYGKGKTFLDIIEGGLSD